MIVSKYRSLAYLMSALTIPAVFVTIILGWDIVDRLIASRDVSRFIRKHQTVVTERLNDPRVHQFHLSHDPMNWGTLLIQIDVDDREAFELLEDDLDGMWSLKFSPRWEITIRSKEDPENNFGEAARGLGLIVEGLVQAVIAAVLSILISSRILLTSFRLINFRPK